MSANTKKTSPSVASKAAATLTSPNASATQKQLAASVLSQARTENQTGKKIETLASTVLNSPKYNALTKELAASALSQSNKNR